MSQFSHIDPVHPPHFHGAAPAEGVLKSAPEDFQVEEVLGFDPSGDGEHCYLWIEKRGWNSNDVAGHLAEVLGIRKRLISHCGLKDKEAITRQWFSLHLPGEDSPSPAQLEVEGIKVLRMDRGTRKLRRGSHDGNRFQLRVREIKAGDTDQINARWEMIRAEGVPNYYGPQRFGRDGGNLAKARSMFEDGNEIRDRFLRGLLISSARSALFNLHIAHRLEGETWDRVLGGEVYGFSDNRSIILPDRFRGDEEERWRKGQIEITGPLWGAGDLLSGGAVFELEMRLAGEAFAQGLEQLGLQQERRVLRLRPRNASGLVWNKDGTEFEVSFDLPKGTYATAVMRELILSPSIDPR